MANPTTDHLFDLPPAESWQNDADVADSNAPADSDSMLHTDPTSLSGTLRRIKSEVRAQSLDPAWINYTGLTTTPSNGVPTALGTRKFSLVGNWAALVVSGQMVRMRFSNTDARPTATIVVAPFFANGFTTFEMNADIITGALEMVEFSTLGSWTAGGGHVPVEFGRLGDDLILEKQYGGTGSNSPTFTGQDLAGSVYPNAIVKSLQNGVHKISTQAPLTTPLDQVMAYDIGAAMWEPQRLKDILGLAITETLVDADNSKGTIRLAAANIPAQLLLKWASVTVNLAATVETGVATPAVEWSAPFASVLHGVWLITGTRDVLFGWQDLVAGTAVLDRNLAFVDLVYRRFDVGGGFPALTARVVAIGLGR